MNEVQADFIVDVEAEDFDRQAIELTGWEDVVFELEDEGEWPWS